MLQTACEIRPMGSSSDAFVILEVQGAVEDQKVEVHMAIDSSFSEVKGR